MATVENPASLQEVQNSRKLLDPSELGTKEYWEAAYAREIRNFEDDGEDEGTVWFEDSNAEETVLMKLSEYDEQGLELLNRESSRFLDLGTGNGHMLFALREENENGVRWTGDMIGVDYSPASVQLARNVDLQRLAALNDGEGDNDADNEKPSKYGLIRFEQWDILAEQPGDWLQDGFDAVLDKGTFDAISLMPREAQAPHPCEVYLEKVVKLIKPGYFLVITSCNWTKDELIDWLAPEGGDLTFYDDAKYRTYTFGGQTGSSVVTIVFRRTTEVGNG
ncbi:s-adenosylmethionine-dependent methyltransferase like protein [Zymoseptoria brevis]|uniref:Protein-lysine N-methyltransferase EFM4 n=1 Tax=Zymoseptoria brevis TaxID=1047168 RepID=A0A0F4GSR6_9PEZI|nr:s-adenosylmethionine-dependent methyltransferase like protein [Zymoseptoria brevis]